MPVVLATYSPGSNLGNLHWLWRTSAPDISSAFQCCQPILGKIKAEIPSFHTIAMWQAVFGKYGLIFPHVKKSLLRHIYKNLVGDSSAAAATSQEEVDEREAAFFEFEEPDLVFDLREVHSGNSPKCDMFCRKAEEFLDEDVSTELTTEDILKSTFSQGDICTLVERASEGKMS